MKEGKHISLKDLACELGISISTVSRALKDSPEISGEVRLRVKALAKEWNYRPNPFAMSLLKNTPRIIGILIPDIVTHFYSSIITGIDNIARQNGYSVIITSSYDSYKAEIQCIEDLVNVRVEGIIACLSQETTDYLHFTSLEDLNIPLVFFDRICLPDVFSSVIADNIESARLATLHLLNTGSKRVAFIGGANHIEIVRQRKHGYLQALREYRIPIDKDLVFCKYMGYSEGYEGACKLLSLSNPPDAILAMTDSIAFGAMKAIKEHRLRIPDDISLIGYTDEMHSNYVDPPLTAITHQTHKMGQTVCHLLLKQIKKREKPQQIIIPTYLAVRESSVKNNQRVPPTKNTI
ncbi:LacI family transcriptional regulator [Dysgonomonas alginatilytica]|uniref:LacI family transcriptional regulator n=1 Tax=Dysgonomonas alginatilytica TaxID=1605892 RepID=A0A2V3PKL9_9BACT|nr:LacI family DNA-binding transcriptional regulator [Dysgonomonas alginatilytica]PXV59965.1 LacI family transcriptional regulator [Dysgonomonas alginatilytica]